MLSFLQNGIVIGLFLFLAGCQCIPPEVDDLTLTPVSYHDLSGWEKDQTREALPAFLKSCPTLLKKEHMTPMRTRKDGQGYAHDWHPFCIALVNNPPKTDKDFRNLIQSHLQPYQVSTSQGTTGLFTGYDEPVLQGSKRRHGPYQTPLYRLPGAKVPYKGMSRSRIVKGGLKNRKLELVWVNDPIGAFFLQIQGSGRVKLENGQVLHLGYAGTNGCYYYPIGKKLIEKGLLSPDTISRQTIVKWLARNPQKAESIMSLNPSYVFFRLRGSEGPIGSQGVPLTPRRSLAVDKQFISLGTPLWLDIEHVDEGSPKMRKLVVAQDTGGAIKGGVRGDLFWGCGPSAADFAGRMKSRGTYYVLLPK